MATSTLGSGTLVLAGTTSGTTTVTATAVAGTTTLTLPAATDTLVGKATTDTLTNKTLTGAVMNGTLGATTPSTVAATSISASTTLGVTGVSTLTGGAVIEGLTVGRGGAGGAANTAYGASAIPIAPNSGVTAIGSNAGKLFNTASDTGQSTFVGYFAGAQVSTGTDSTFVGGSAGTNTTTGAQNTAVGSQALQLNTTASNNTAVGYQAGYSNTTSSSQTFVGYQAGYNTTGQGNTFVGKEAGLGNTTGQANTYLGNNSGASMTTGSKNTIVGIYSGNQGGLDIRTASNYIVLSDGDGNPRAYCNNNGTWVFNSSTATIYCLGTYNSTTATAANTAVLSDGSFARSTSALKYKQDIRDIEAIDINLLRGVRYKSKCEGDDQTKDHFGIVADEVDAAGIKELVSYGATGEVEGFQYERLTVVLLKAIQELKAEVDSLKAQINGASA